MEMSLKLSVPLTIALGGWFLGTLNSNRQNEIAQANQKDAVIREYIKEMKGMLLDTKVAKEAKRAGSELNGVARALTLTALAQLKGEGPERRTLVFQFLRESNFPILAGSDSKLGANLVGYDLRETNLFMANLSKANLKGAYLSSANLFAANLSRADLSGANLIWAGLVQTNLSGADLTRASLIGADLSGSNLMVTNLSYADLTGIRWDEKTEWPAKEAFKGARNIPPELKRQLGLV
ncbi:pentapeptide repeat-containing protein [Cyanobium sp. N5-Cardenillas]|nr:pentapeptide repeat-containing protein [Cyanobium sp. N5-Cardenillas]